MLNNLLKIGTMIVAGRWLKPRWKGLFLLVIFWLAVRLLHAEYVQYVQLSQDIRWLWQISLVKIGLYLAGLLIYLLIVERPLFLGSGARSKPAGQPSATIPATAGEGTEDDGCDFLREKPVLESQTDKLLNRDRH